MSSDTTSLPAWKQALLDRKRHQENGGPSIATKADSSRTVTNTTANPADATPAIGSTWKQTTLSKKLQQYSTPSSTSSSSAPSTAAEKEMGVNRTENHTSSGVTEIQVDSVDDALMEERLLPIKQNPILLSDRQKRHKSKANHSRSSERRASSRKSDPRAATLSTKSTGSDEGVPSASDGSVTPDTSPAVHVDDAIDEVFEEEVTYGKGFVHKLLRKFITLTGKDEPAVPSVAPTKTQGSVRSIGDVPKGSTTTTRSSSNRSSASDLKPSRLAANSDVESSRRSWDENALHSTDEPSADKTSKDPPASRVEVHPKPLTTVDSESLSGQSNVVDPDDLPHNIVSTARGIFENNTDSTISTRKKSSAPERPSTKRSAPEKPPLEVTFPDRSSAEPPATNKPIVDRTGDLSPSLRRWAPERPFMTEETVPPGRNLGSWKNNLATSMKDREVSASLAPAISSDPAGKPLLQNASVGRVLYPAGVGAKNRVRLDDESNRNEKNDEKDRVAQPLVITEKPETTTGNSMGISRHDDEVEKPSVKAASKLYEARNERTLPSMNTNKPEIVTGNSMGISKRVDDKMEKPSEEEKPPSVRAASKLYEAKNERTQNSRFVDGQNVGTKNSVKLSAESHTVNRNTDSVNLSRPYINASVTDKEPTKEEAKQLVVTAAVGPESRLRKTDWRKTDDDDSMSKSDSSDVTTTSQGLTRTPLNVSEQLKDNNVQTHDLTTRVRVGAFESQSVKSSVVENSATVEYSSNAVPSISSIRTENQVTVIQIGSAASAKLPGKLENVEAKATVQISEASTNKGGKVVNADLPVSLQSGNSSVGRKGVTIQVGSESDRIDAKIDGLHEYNGIRSDNRYDSSRIEARNDTKNDTRNDSRNDSRNDTRSDSRNDTRNVTRNDILRNDTSSRNMTNLTSRKADADKGMSRPGMLLIRPASNLVASKTKTEYLTMTKYNDIKKGEFAPAKQRPIAVEELMMNGDVVDRGGSVFEVVGGGVSFGRSLLAKTKHGKKLSINFDDSALRTHEYPSEQSLMAATPAQPGDCDYVDENSVANDNGDDNGVANDNDDPRSSDLLRSNPALTASGGNLSSYIPRGQVDYEFGMLRLDDAVELAPPSPDPESKSRMEASVDGLSETTGEEDATWSQSSSSDLLF